MITKIEKFLMSSKTVGLEVRYSSPKEYKVLGCNLKRSKGELSIYSYAQFDSLPEAIQPIKKSTAVAVAVTGSVVITKKVDQVVESNREALQMVLPGGKESDFEIQLHTTDTATFISLVRVSVINDLIEEVRQAGLSIVQFILGPFSTEVLINYLSKDDRVELPCYNLEVVSGVINQIENTSNSSDKLVNIGGQGLGFQFQIAMAVAVQYYSGFPQTCILNDQLVKGRRELRFLKLIWGLGIEFALFALLAGVSSFTLNRHYEKAKAGLESKSSFSQAIYKELMLSKTELSEKTELLQITGIQKQTQLALYLDRIASVVPKEIVLYQLEVNPLTSSLKNNKRPGFDESHILVSGIADRSKHLNDFVEAIQELDWAEEVRIVTYDKQNRRDPGLFEISIQIEE